MNDFYPPLPEQSTWALDIILQNLEQDPNYLEYSPYSSEDLAVLEKLVIRVDDVEEEEELDPSDKWGRLERESNKLYKGLIEFSGKLESKDNAETMAYFRTATSLLDKIVGIQERTANLKQISRFHDTVLRVMEDVLDPGQRTEVMDLLRAATKPQE